jgi:hypothetical protein
MGSGFSGLEQDDIKIDTAKAYDSKVLELKLDKNLNFNILSSQVSLNKI